MFKHIVLIAVALLALLVSPVIANQAPPVEVNGFAVEMPLTAFATHDLQVEMPEMSLLDALEPPILEVPAIDSLTQMTCISPNLWNNDWMATIKPIASNVILSGNTNTSYYRRTTLRGDWQANVGYNSL